MVSTHTFNKFLLLLHIFLFLNIPLSGFAQKEGNIWYFGRDGKGLDFNQQPPQILSNGTTDYDFGNGDPVIMADECGRLLFYTSALHVWNARHEIMLNGDSLEAAGGAQNVVAIPYPGLDSIYILFTARCYPEYARTNLRYSIIDMHLDKGRGAVTNKNIFLFPKGPTQMTAARHADNRSYWLLTVEKETNRFLAFLVNEQGVQPNPVISVVPNARFANSDAFKVKVSPDSKRVIVGCVLDVGNVSNIGSGILLSFDNATGKISNPITLPNAGLGVIYEFSADSRKVFAAYDGGISQYLLDQPTGEGIFQTRYAIPNSRQTYSMALAPDKKIYISRFSGRTLDVITNPDAIGPAVNFITDGVPINGNTWILPNNLSSFILGKQQSFRAEAACQFDPVRFIPTTNYRVLKYFWDFGDLASGETNQSGEESPVHTFSDGGTYRVRMVTLNRCQEYDTIYQQINVSPDLLVELPDSTEVCFREAPVSFTVPEYTFTQYRWNTGDTTRSIQASSTGWYHVTVSNPCATRQDSVYLSVIPQVQATIPNDTVVCDGNFALLDARNEGASYRWNTGETTRTIQTDQPGTYWVDITNRCSSVVDTAALVFIPEDVGAFTTNVFTPNGDGYNDRFVNYLRNTPGYRMRIVNRWGETVFDATNANDYWDGTQHGRALSSGLYYSALQTQDCRGNPLQLKGIVTLLK